MGRGLIALMLGAALAVLWITLSGRIHDQLTLSFGAASVLIVLLLIRRMGLLDAETAPFRRIVTLALYWVWLGGEIFKANVAVARAILKPNLDIAPQLVRVPAALRTDFGRTVYANSITLTPGTVTVDIAEDEFLIHALLDPMADPVGFEAMSARARRAAEGGH